MPIVDITIEKKNDHRIYKLSRGKSTWSLYEDTPIILDSKDLKGALKVTIKLINKEK